MNQGLYVALSGQIATERRLTTIADNIANMNTVGFRQVGVRFSELVEGPAQAKKSFAAPGVTTLSEAQGAIDSTGNQLDFAINGDGWFMVQTPAGEALTRDGRFKVNTEGMLADLDGYPVLDQGGAPVQINLAAGSLNADASGILFQKGAAVGGLGIFNYARPDETLRAGSLGFLPDGAVTPAADRTDFSVQQGFVEKSNVNAVEQIARLISVQRNFEQNASLVQQSESSLSEAIRLLGGK
jgi:flagellar basal-body rod protein FlgF